MTRVNDVREIKHANEPVDWNGPNWDRPMWFTRPVGRPYEAGYERCFGDRCYECGGHMSPGDEGLHCEHCGSFRVFSDAVPDVREAAEAPCCEQDHEVGSVEGGQAGCVLQGMPPEIV